MNLSLRAPGQVRAEVYDVHGRLVAVVRDGMLAPGTHRLEWDGSARGGRTIAAGVYFMQVRAGAQVRREKFVVFR